MSKYARAQITSLDGRTGMGAMLRRVPRGARVLEFGTATGYMTEYLRDTLGCTVTGIEYDADAAREAERWCERMIVTDLDDLASWTEPLAGESYDVLVFADVLEHVRDPWAVLRHATQLLATDGIVLTSIPHVGHDAVFIELYNGRFVYRDLGLLDNTHIRFFTRRSVHELLTQADLRVAESIDVTCAPNDSELRVSYDDAPSELSAALHTRRDGRTYQFLHVSQHAATGEADPRELRRAPLVSIVVVASDGNAQATLTCLSALSACTPDDLYDVVVIDNGTTDDTAHILQQLSGDIVVRRASQPTSMPRALTHAMSEATGRFVVLLSSPVIVTAGWLQPLLTELQMDPTLGACSSLVLSAADAGRSIPFTRDIVSTLDPELVAVRRDAIPATDALRGDDMHDAIATLSQQLTTDGYLLRRIGDSIAIHPTDARRAPAHVETPKAQV